MPKFTPDQEKLVKNHMPTVKDNAEVFLRAFDATLPDEGKIAFLIALIEQMETDLAGVKTMLEDHE